MGIIKPKQGNPAAAQNSVVWAVVTAIAASSFSPVASSGDLEPQMAVRFSLSMGNTARPMLRLDAGSTLQLSTAELAEIPTNLLPVSGLSYASGGGIAPLVMGVRQEPDIHGSNASGGSGFHWGWIAAGAAAVVGIAVLAAGSGKDEDDPYTDENSCVTNSTGSTPIVDVDGDCVGG